DSIIVKIFDVEKNQQIVFRLDSNAYDMTFDLYDLMRNYFLKEMSVNTPFNKLSKGDQETLDDSIDSFFKSFKNKNNQSYDLYIGLQDEYCEFDNTVYTRNDFIDVLTHIGVFDAITSIIDTCLDESNKRKDEIKKIIYTGDVSMIYDIQEKINSYYQIHQDIMEDEEKLTCLGGFLASSCNYTIVDHSLKIGMMKKEKKGYFKTIDIFNECISSYSTIISQSRKFRIPKNFDGQLEIYEGYNGASKNDCILLSQLDISKYCNGHYRLSIERKAMGGDISVVIYDKGKEVDRLKVGD
ncbi:MAG: hypothetical protein LUH02_06395, partial [Erysipelotrichaceae bacterium]|nr:hypothetical protein [Erysipelotrichaceae bacterium]